MSSYEILKVSFDAEEVIIFIFMTKYCTANSYRFAGFEKEYTFIQKWPFGI